MDYYSPQKAVVIAGSRVGSTMLCNALDSHPLISCDRSEPLNPITSPYLQAGLTNEQTLKIVLGRPGFQWCMCKVSYRQLRKQVSLQDVTDWGVTKFIHLWRENALRVVVSAALNTARVQGKIQHPTHAWETPPLQTIELDAQDILAQARLYLERVEHMKEALSNREALTLTYETLTIHPDPILDIWLPEPVESAINTFLDVEDNPLEKIIQPVNPYSLSEIISNWAAVRLVLLDSEFAYLVTEVEAE